MKILRRFTVRENAKRGKLVKILGHEVREGTKKWQILVAQKKQADDLQRSERKNRRSEIGSAPMRGGGLRTRQGFTGKVTAVKLADNLTDRAHRYRAHAPGVEPPPPKQCGFCGSRRNVVPHHILGNESDSDPDNLMWACKRCNGSVHAKMRPVRLGRLTHQYNPPKGTRRDQMRAYGAAIKVMRGEFEGDVAAAVRTIRATPRDVRSAFTARSWPVRRQIYGPSGRQQAFGFDEIPF